MDSQFSAEIKEKTIINHGLQIQVIKARRQGGCFNKYLNLAKQYFKIIYLQRLEACLPNNWKFIGGFDPRQ